MSDLMNEVPLSAKFSAKDYNRQFDFKMLGYGLITVAPKILYAHNMLTEKAVVQDYLHLVSTVDNSIWKKQHQPSWTEQVTISMTESP